MGKDVMLANKKACLNKHAKKRAEERFGVTLNRYDLYNVSSAIRSQNAKFKQAISNRVTAWIVNVPNTNEEAIALYDKHRKCVITFLPLDYSL